MARVQLAPMEIDHNFRVENAIAVLLCEHETAEISMESIDLYQLEDADAEVTVNQKLDQIVAELRERFEIDAEYRMAGDDLQFFRGSPRHTK
jgi:hypothetical protein